MNIFFELWAPNWQIVFKFRSDIGDKGFKQDLNIFGREGMQNLVSANVSSGINMLYNMQKHSCKQNDLHN